MKYLKDNIMFQIYNFYSKNRKKITIQNSKIVNSGKDIDNTLQVDTT